MVPTFSSSIFFSTSPVISSVTIRYCEMIFLFFGVKSRSGKLIKTLFGFDVHAPRNKLMLGCEIALMIATSFRKF